VDSLRVLANILCAMALVRTILIHVVPMDSAAPQIPVYVNLDTMVTTARNGIVLVSLVPAHLHVLLMVNVHHPTLVNVTKAGLEITVQSPFAMVF
jgi:hypothetical protein